jgi:ABC-type glycerol-3-phosphate transport system permease component
MAVLAVTLYGLGTALLANQQTIAAQTRPVLLAAGVILAIIPPGVLALALRRYLTRGQEASIAR